MAISAIIYLFSHSEINKKERSVVLLTKLTKHLLIYVSSSHINNFQKINK